MNKIKSMFLPRDVKEGDIPPLLLGDGFSTKSNREEGFYCTGKYYLINKTFKGHEDIEIYVISFDRNNRVYEMKTITIKKPVYEEWTFIQNKFDPSGGKVFHIVERKNGNTMVIDLFYYYIGDLLEMNFKSITIEPNHRNLFIQYNRAQFNEFHIDLVESCDNGNEALVFSAFFCPINDIDYDDPEYDEDAPWIYERRACLDILRINTEKVWHVKRVLVDLSASPDVFDIYDVPKTHYLPDKIYFYQEYVNGDSLAIHECDYNGKHKFTYSVLNDDLRYGFEPHGNISFLYSFKDSDSFVRFYKLEEGEIETIKEIHLVHRHKEAYYSVGCSFKRFDEHILPVLASCQRHNPPLSYQNFKAISLDSEKLIVEMHDEGISRSVNSVNWNIEEIAMTYFHGLNIFTELIGKGEMFFVLRRSNFIVENFSLKHLSRLAVLTYFTEEKLMSLNLPLHLFQYLGIKKYFE